MNRTSLGWVAVRLYPEAVRAERGGELVGTVLDAGEASRAAFVGQLASVAGAGLAARARQALTQPVGQIASDTLAWAAVMTVVTAVVWSLGMKAHASGDVRFANGTFVTFVLPVLVVVAFTLKRTRISGIVGVALCVFHLLQHPGWVPVVQFAKLGLPLAGFALLVFAPGRVSPSGRWAWAVPAAVFAYFSLSQAPDLSSLAYIRPPSRRSVFFRSSPPSRSGWRSRGSSRWPSTPDSSADSDGGRSCRPYCSHVCH